MKVKEVKTLFVLEEKEFRKQVKELGKIVDGFQKDFNQTNREVTALSKELSNISKTYKLLKQDNPFKGVTNDLREIKKELISSKKELSNVKDNLKTIEKFDTTSFNKLNDIAKSVSKLNIIREDNLKSALDTINKISMELKSLNSTDIKLNIDLDSLKNKINDVTLDTNLKVSEESISNMSKAIENSFENSLKKIYINNGESPNNQEVQQLINGFRGILAGLTGVTAMETLNANTNKNAANNNAKNANENSKSIKNFNDAINKFESQAKNFKLIAELDVDGYQEVKAFNDALDAIESKQKMIERLSEATGQNYEDAKKAVEKMLARQKELTDETTQFANQQDKAGNEIKQNTKELDKQSGSMSNLVKLLGSKLGGTKLDSVFSSITGNVNELNGALNGATKAGGAATKGMSGLAKGLGYVGVAVAATTALFYAYAKALQFSIRFMSQATSVASGYQSALAILTNKIGATSAELPQLSELLKDTFRNQGFTSDINELGDALSYVRQMLLLDGDEASGMTNQLLAISRSFGYDIREVTRAQASMMNNLGVSAQQSLDIMTRLRQETGDGYDDLLDTFQEYSQDFAKMGLDAEYMFGVLRTGMQSGAMNYDKIADSFREFYNRINEGVEEQTTALNKLGLSASKIGNAFSKGGNDAKNAMNQVIQSIAGVQDKAEQKNLVTTLFGTPSEGLGQEFFDMLAQAETSMEEINGSAQNVADTLENTLGAQLTKINNSFTDLWNILGEQLLPLVMQIATDITNNFEEIRATVEEVLAPALQRLGVTIAVAFGLDEINDFSDVLINIITIVANVINAFSKFVIFMKKVIAVGGLIGNSFQLAFDFIIGGILVLIKWFNTLFYGILGSVEGLVRSIDNALMLLGKGFANLGIAIINSVKNAGIEAYNWLLRTFVNPAIRAMNLIPGMNIKEVGYADSSKGNMKYISIQDELNGFKDAFGKDNYFFKALDESNKQFYEYYDPVFDRTNKNIQDFQNDWKSLFEDEIATINELLETVKDLSNKGTVTSNNKGTGTGSPTGTYTPNKNGGSVSGYDQTEKEKAAAKKKQDELEKQRKEAEEKRIKAMQDYYKKLFDLQRKWQEKMIKYETSIAEQRWDLMDNDAEKLQDQYEFYDKIMKNYKLTADQMIDYMNKKNQVAISLRDYYLDEMNKLINEQVEKEKKALEETTNAQKEANNEKIKEYQRYIREIERQMNKLENQWEDEDREDEINKVKKELEKYKDATSIDGIKRRQELEEQLNDLLKDKERDEIKDRLEDQKEGWEDQIEGLEDANEKIDKEYEENYKEIEETVKNGEMNIYEIQEYIREEANGKLKRQLQEMVDAYNEAYDKIKESTLNMDMILGWEKNDANNNIIEGGLTGNNDLVEEGNNIKDLIDNQGQKINPDYIKIKELQAQWNALGDGKNSKDPKIKAKQDALNKQANEIRAKYGLKYPDMPPKFIPKYHNGGIVKGKELPNGDVPALLQNNEVVFTKDQFNSLINFLNGFNNMFKVPTITPALSGAYGITNNITNNNTIDNSINLNTPKIELYKNADLNGTMQEIALIQQIRNNSIGKRNL